MTLDIKRLFANREQELLLKAALLEGEDAATAWHKWKNSVDLEEHQDNGSFRLFPLLYKNLQQQNIKDPFMQRLKGIYRQAWYKNQKLFYYMSKMLRSLHAEGIRTMILKGAALTVLHYKNYAVRPMTDIDVLIHSSHALLAADVLKRAGWHPTAKFTEDDLIYRHSKQFKDNSGEEFELHWHLLFDSHWDGADNDFWDGAVPLKIGGIPSLAPNSADMLLHVIVHGIKWNPEPPIRWIADAACLINSFDAEMNWERLIAQARKHHVILYIKKALNYLHQTYKVSIPAIHLNTINTIRLSPMEFIEYRYVTRDLCTNSNTVIDYSIKVFLKYFLKYRHLSKYNDPQRFDLIGLYKYLQYRMNTRNT